MSENIKLYMNKRRIALVAAVTVITVVILTLFAGKTIYSVNKRIEQSCFDDLELTAKQLSNELYSSVGSDHTTLSAIATIIANQDELSDDELCQIISSYDFEATYVSYLEILKPDGMMLYDDGFKLDVSSAINYDEEAEKGECISGVCQSKRNPESSVVRHAVPIRKDGQIVYILYGVVNLTDLEEKYKTDIYDGHAYVYIIDGDSGVFIPDTWHKSRSNISDFSKREPLQGYSIEELEDNIKNARSGEIAFVSKTTGNVLYMRYEPLKINNWSVAISVEDDYALAKSKSISTSLYLMAGICAAILLVYFAFVVLNLLNAYRQVKKLGTEDQNTALLNRNAFEKYVADSRSKTFAEIACVYVDANGLHAINNERGHSEGDKMLKLVADTLKEYFADALVFRIGGDEFVVLSEKDNQDDCVEKMRSAAAQIEHNGYSISYGIAGCLNKTGLDSLVREADEHMLKNKGAYYQQHDRRRV